MTAPAPSLKFQLKTWHQVFTVAQRIGGVGTALISTVDERTTVIGNAASWTLTPAIDVVNDAVSFTFNNGTTNAVAAILCKVEFTEVGGW